MSNFYPEAALVKASPADTTEIRISPHLVSSDKDEMQIANRQQAESDAARNVKLQKSLGTAEGTLSRKHSLIFGPPDSECVRVAKAFKKALDTTGIVWRERMMMLTKDRILFVEVGDERRNVLDYIDLCDMVECEVKKDADNGNDEELILRTTEDGRNW